jgi:4-hydroxy 2-oxovalerate aldolase
MGRGPGNARTEELVIEAETLLGREANLVPLMALIRNHLGPMKAHHGWGTNPYYYLAGKFGIHPTFIQEMLGDARYDDEDLLAVITQLRSEGGKKFSFNTLDGARHFYRGAPRGNWAPASAMAGRDVLILGSGPGVVAHRAALEAHIGKAKPLVVALNTQEAIDPALIDLRVACHPVRLLADAETHARQTQPLVTPASMLPDGVLQAFGGKTLLDFGLGIEPGRFAFHDTWCMAPTSLVLAYALAMATSGQAARIHLAGFDGYAPGDPRNDEIEAMLSAFAASGGIRDIMSVTPTSYRGLNTCSIHGL